MHGLYHVFDTEAKGIVTAKKRSEFAGHSYEEQYDRIKKGKEILLSHNISTDVFFAPAHSYDDNTLKALYANGFRYISDGLSCKPYIRQGIICVPCRSAGIPKIGKKGYYTVVLHAHEWVRPDKAKDWHGFNQICDDYMTDIVSFEVYKEGPLGNQYIQMINERLYYWFVLLKRFLTRRILKRL
jgi:predicted deacetylase